MPGSITILGTELAAVRTALVAADQTGPAALAVGIDPFAIIDLEIKHQAETKQRLKDLQVRMPAGAAKTALTALLAP